MGWLLLVFLAVSVKEDQTPLRAGCAPDATVVTVLPAGTTVKLRYALSGESVPCYKVATDADGKHFEGYLRASQIDGLDSFTQARQEAGWVEVKATPTPSPADGNSKPAAPRKGIRIRASAAAVHANEIIGEGRFDEALGILDAEISRHPDAGLYAMAGTAARQSDDNRRALEYFRKSLELESNPDVEALVKELDREYTADHSNAKLYGVRVALRFDSDAIPVETARQMIGTIDETLTQVSQQLGCPNDEKVVTIAQTWEAYRKSVGFVEWSGGVFDGRIRVPMDRGTGMNEQSRRTLAHEATHACLSRFGNVPGWLHEGLAQKLSGESISPVARAAVTTMAREGKLASLVQLGSGFGGLNSQQARVAYTQALMAVEILLKDYGNDGLRNILRNPERIASIAPEIDKRLAQ